MTTPPQFPKPKGRPSRLYYLSGALVLLLGGAIFSYYVYTAFTSFSWQAKQIFPARLLAPGSYEIDLENAADYSIYYEYESELNGKQYHTSKDDKSFDISLARKKTGDKIELNNPFGTYEYTLPSRKGIAISTFEISEPGVYTFEVSRSGSQTDEQGVVAIESGILGFIGTSIVMVLTGIAIFLLTIMLAVGITIFIYTKRNKGSRLKVDESQEAKHDKPRPIHPK